MQHITAQHFLPPSHSFLVSSPGLSPCDDCTGSFWPVLIYIIFNCAYNVFIMLVIKHGSAALMYVACALTLVLEPAAIAEIVQTYRADHGFVHRYIVMTLRLPLVQVAFSVRFINDPPDVFHWPSLIGLACIVLGLVAYRWKPADASDGEEDVVVVGAGLAGLPLAIRRNRIGLRRDAKAIRSDLYSRLGVIPSPVTPHSPHQRKMSHEASRSGTPSRARTPQAYSSVRAQLN